MSMLSGVRLDERAEAIYRRGYIRGVESMIEAVSGKLTQAQAKALRNWAQQDLDSWRQSPTTGREESPTPPTL